MEDIVARFETYAELCRAVQRKAIELENHPERKKRLRRFAAAEVAEILGISPGYLRSLVHEPDFPSGAIGPGGRRSFALAEIHAARAWLFAHTGNPRYAPRRRPEAGEKLQVVTFVNFKGGSGKTTTAVHFAQYLALRGYRVLLVDLDPQASATALFGLDPESEVRDATFASWLDRSRDARALVRPTHWDGLDLVPASIALQHAEYDLVGRLLERRDFPFYAQLAELLVELEAAYDVVVCDCRPDVGMLTLNALWAATGLVVPVPPSMLDFASSGEFFRFLAEVARDFRGSIARDALAFDFVRIVTTRFKASDRNQAEIVRWKRALFRDAVLAEAMVDTALVDAAGILKETLYEYEPAGNRRTYERGLEAVRRVDRALERELLRVWGRPVEA
ncbi:MAG: AAA family ATPase [Geminicoccaceae bacterium]|nr:AAA family ATPase [Geminicoccaceae bacterium]MDW8444029.1 AAA family ATPase [Acetobacteraceae bacterium]